MITFAELQAVAWNVLILGGAVLILLIAGVALVASRSSKRGKP